MLSVKLPPSLGNSGKSLPFGFIYLIKGLKLTSKPEIHPYILIPFLIVVVCYIALAWSFQYIITDWISTITSSLPSWLHFLQVIINPLLIALLLIVIYFSFNILVGFFGAPFHSLLSEKILADAGLVEENKENYFKLLLSIIIKTISREFSKLRWMLFRIIIIAILTLLPIVNIISPILWFTFITWMTAIQFIDYAAENRGYSFAETRKYLSSYRVTIFSFGLSIYLLLLIPIVNFITLPVSVIAGTLIWIDTEKMQQLTK